MSTSNFLKTAGLATVGAAFAMQVSAAELTLKFGHVGNPGSLFEISATEFAKRANAKLKGKAQVQVFGSSQLGSDKELLKKLKLGTVNFALPSSVMASQVGEFGMFDMPYLVIDRKHMARIEKEIVRPAMLPLAAKKGLKIIALWENGFRHITNNKHPIDVPGDLAGIKLRTPKSVWRVKMFKAYGANPSPLSFSEVFVALQTGTFDGQENPFAQIASAKFQEVQKYLSLTGHVYTPAYVTVDTKHFAKLPAAVQKAVTQAAEETQAFVYKTAAKLEDDLLAQLKAGGMQVNTANKAAFIKASAKIYKEFAATVPGGGPLVEKALSLGK